MNNFVKNNVNTNTQYTISSQNKDTEQYDILLSHLDDTIKATKQTLNDLTVKRENLFNVLKLRKDKKEEFERHLDDIMNNENFEEEQEKYMLNRMKRNTGSVSEAITKKNSFKIDDISIIEKGGSSQGNNDSEILDENEVIRVKYLNRAYSAYSEKNKNKNKLD